MKRCYWELGHVESTRQMKLPRKSPYSKMAIPGLFLFIYKQFYKRKTVDFSGIRTQIVRREGQHADCKTITTAKQLPMVARAYSSSLYQFWSQPCKLVAVTGVWSPPMMMSSNDCKWSKIAGLDRIGRCGVANQLLIVCFSRLNLRWPMRIWDRTPLQTMDLPL